MTSFTEIPIVDLADWDAPDADHAVLAERLSTICHEVGFFVVVNHGISLAFVDSLFELMRGFFALPVEDKLLIDKRTSRHFRGWEPEGAEYTNNRPDIREQIDLWTDQTPLPRDAEPAYLRLLGPNQWMPEHLVPGFESTVRRWFADCGELSNRLLEILTTGLGLPAGSLTSHFADTPMSLTKLIHYPPTPDGQAGVNAHHDAGFLTVLAPGPTPGLQVQNGDGDWVDMPSVPGGFVINLGEMLQGITGNYFVATAHRVITSQERYSAGYFHGPSLQTPLDRLPLDARFADAVSASPFHSDAGFMARREETEAGVGDIGSRHKPDTYGEQLWNYFSRSYPENMARFYS